MCTKLVIGGLLASVALFPSFAQQVPAPAAPGKTTATTMQRTEAATVQWRASKLVGVDVYNAANENIGEINEVILDSSGKVAGVVIGVGGFLGMGEHDVLVQLNQLKFVSEPVRTTTTTTTTSGTGTTTRTTRPARDANEKWYPDHAVMNATKEQLKALPAFKYD